MQALNARERFIVTERKLREEPRTLESLGEALYPDDPAARERFRRRSYVSPVATGVVSGFGPFSYELAVRAALRLAQERRAAADRSV